VAPARSLASVPGIADVLNLVPNQPGVNRVRYAAKTGYLYYTSTGQQLFMRVPVDPGTHDPAGDPEFVSGGTMADDFCLDEDAGVAYVTTHRQNTIDRVPLGTGSSDARQIVAGEPFSEELIGPSSAAWGRRPGDYGRIAYVTTDGGLVAPPPDGIVRPAKLLQIELAGAALLEPAVDQVEVVFPDRPVRRLFPRAPDRLAVVAERPGKALPKARRLPP
jgi:hypothetical protein